MGTLFLILFHILAVAAVYVSAYRTGFAVCAANTRREAEACVAPLTEALERLNLDIETLLEEPTDTRQQHIIRGGKRDFRPGRGGGDRDKAAS